jgi:hypothetical protein
MKPLFAGLMEHYPRSEVREVLYKQIGWEDVINHPAFQDTCAIRMSLALLSAGVSPSGANKRYVEDWKIVECLSLSSRRSAGSIKSVQAYIRLKLLTGMRRGDLLRLAVADLKKDGIHVTPRKTQGTTGKRLIIRWSDELRDTVELA